MFLPIRFYAGSFPHALSRGIRSKTGSHIKNPNYDEPFSRQIPRERGCGNEPAAISGKTIIRKSWHSLSRERSVRTAQGIGELISNTPAENAGKPAVGIPGKIGDDCGRYKEIVSLVMGATQCQDGQRLICGNLESSEFRDGGEFCGEVENGRSLQISSFSAFNLPQTIVKSPPETQE